MNMRTYNGISGTTGVHTFVGDTHIAKLLLEEAMIMMGNINNYKIISESKDQYSNIRVSFSTITYEVFEPKNGNKDRRPSRSGLDIAIEKARATGELPPKRNEPLSSKELEMERHYKLREDYERAALEVVRMKIENAEKNKELDDFLNSDKW